MFAGKLSLIGFMGAGKSSVARILSDRLALPLFETDDEILRRAGMKTVAEIFAAHSESYFRELEESVISSFSQISAGIISPGGGAIENPRNLQALKAQNGKLVYLETSLEVIQSRLPLFHDRPLFRNPAAALQLFEQRKPLYQQAADLTLITDRLTKEQVADHILTWLST